MSKPDPFNPPAPFVEFPADALRAFQRLENIFKPYEPSPDEIEKLGATAVPNWFGAAPNQYRALCFPEFYAGEGEGWRHHVRYSWIDEDPNLDPRVKTDTRTTHPKYGSSERASSELSPGRTSRVTRAAFDQVWERAMARRAVE